MKASRKDANDTHDFLYPFFLFSLCLINSQKKWRFPVFVSFYFIGVLFSQLYSKDQCDRWAGDGVTSIRSHGVCVSDNTSPKMTCGCLRAPRSEVHIFTHTLAKVHFNCTDDLVASLRSCRDKQ